MNELSNHNFTGQELANLIGMQSENVNAILGKVGELSKSMDSMKRYVKEELADVRSDIKDIKDNSEVSTQQKNSLRRAVNKQVCILLGVNPKKNERTDEEIAVMTLYSHIFHQRCYSEVSRLGHLAQPYECTTAQNFIPAIEDIEAWTPNNGIKGLKEEADKIRKIRNGGIS